MQSYIEIYHVIEAPSLFHLEGDDVQAVLLVCPLHEARRLFVEYRHDPEVASRRIQWYDAKTHWLPCVYVSGDLGILQDAQFKISSLQITPIQYFQKMCWNLWWYSTVQSLLFTHEIISHIQCQLFWEYWWLISTIQEIKYWRPLCYNYCFYHSVEFLV